MEQSLRKMFPRQARKLLAIGPNSQVAQVGPPLDWLAQVSPPLDWLETPGRFKGMNGQELVNSDFPRVQTKKSESLVFCKYMFCAWEDWVAG